MRIYSVILLLSLILNSCSNPEPVQSPEAIVVDPVLADSYEEEKELLGQSVGTQAQLFGAALMTQIYFRNRMLKMIQASQASRIPLKFSAAAGDGLHFNELVHTLNLANHHMDIGGSPNVDTRYSIIFFDLSKGPQVLTVPPIADRYFSINIADAYLGNQPYICSRKGDTTGGRYLFTGPDFVGAIPAGMIEVPMPQNEFITVLRIYVKDRNTDNDQVTLIQNEFAFESLDKHLGFIQQEVLTPVTPVPMKKGIDYFEQMISMMQSNPPEGQQEFIWNMLKQVGVSSDDTFDASDLDPAYRTGIVQGIQAGKKIIQWRARQRGQLTDSNWAYSLTMGVDHNDYMHRSEWAVQGLIVGSPKEALFFNSFLDGEGEPLDGAKSYTIHIPADKMPPVNEFWSITSYGEDFNIVPNEKLHYGVGSRMGDDMVYNDDGSLTFTVQSEEPAEGLTNWIPTPESGPFKLNFRFYNPKDVMLNPDLNSQHLPPIVEVKMKN